MKPTMGCVCGGRPTNTEAIEVQPVAGDILLGLEHDDMDLRSKHTAKDHKATQADWDTHGSGLNLQKKEEETGLSGLALMDKSYAIDQAIAH